MPFVCATTGNAAGMGLPPIPQSPTCETPTVVSYVYRPTSNPTTLIRTTRLAAARIGDRADDDAWTA